MTDGHLEQGLRVAESYLTAGNADAALTGIREVLSNDPDHSEALQLLVRALLQKDDANGAEDAADRLISTAPEYDGGYRFKAAIMADRDKKSEREATRDYIERACQLNPDQPANRVVLAQIQEQGNDFPGAEETLRTAISEFPWYHDLKTTYANFLVNRGRMDEANAVFEEVSEQAPGDIDVIILRGTMALRESRIDEAYENAMWALNEDATDPAAVQLLAQVKMRRNPILGIGWRYAAWISRFTNRQVIMIIIGIWLVWQVVFRGLLKQLPQPIPVISALAWFSFCILTWLSPVILRRMVKKELGSVRIRDF